MQITRGKIPGATKICVYGVEGIGKTTFASHFPDPLFIDTEAGTTHMDVKRLPKPDAWIELLGEVDWVYNHPDCCKTLVIDTADWAERLCFEAICAQNKVESIEAFSYGRGYVYAMEEFGRLLDKLENVRKHGIHILIVAHAIMRKFEQPDELGAYDRWELKLSKKIAPMVREWVDALFFVNYRTLVINVDGKGAAKGKNKVQGGKRIMYMSHQNCFDAKNRFGLPEEADFSYEVVRAAIEGSTGGTTMTTAATPPQTTTATTTTATQTSAPTAPPAQKPTEAAQSVPPAARTNPQPEPEKPPAPPQGDDSHTYDGLPDALVRMMQEAEVTPDEVKGVIAQKGIYPLDTSWRTICANEQFMQGRLLHPQVWPQVVNAARMNREDDPF